MKTLLLATAIIVAIAYLAGCSLPPMRAKACYIGRDGEVCVGTDGRAIEVEANYRQPNQP